MQGPGQLEKARKVQLEPGFSLMAWTRLSADADLSGGVGLADPDDESHWTAWPVAEIRKHNRVEDFWTVVRGKVYNLTPYLRYHPGGIDILKKTAGNDGTVLFDKYHKWVNVEALLEACFIGVVAARSEDASDEEDADAGVATSGAAHRRRNAAGDMRVVWNEENLAAREAERGIEYGTQKIDQPETPFLYYEDGPGAEGAHEPSMAIHSNYLPTFLPPEAGATGRGPAGPRQMSATELQTLLGQLETDDHGEALLAGPKYTEVRDDRFDAKRQAAYAGEAHVAAASAGLPEGWSACLSRSEPREIFYVHLESKATQWERPGTEPEPHAGAGGGGGAS